MEGNGALTGWKGKCSKRNNFNGNYKREKQGRVELTVNRVASVCSLLVVSSSTPSYRFHAKAGDSLSVLLWEAMPSF